MLIPISLRLHFYAFKSLVYLLSFCLEKIVHHKLANVLKYEVCGFTFDKFYVLVLAMFIRYSVTFYPREYSQLSSGKIEKARVLVGVT